MRALVCGVTGQDGAYLAELLLQLASFETYSAECASRSPADAELHAHLHHTAGMARALFAAHGLIAVVADPQGEMQRLARATGLGWDWRQFAPAVIGNITWMPELHHAASRLLALDLQTLERNALGSGRHVSEALQRFLAAWQPLLLQARSVPEARGLIRFAVDVDPLSL